MRDLFIEGDDPYDIDRQQDAAAELQEKADTASEATRRTLDRRRLAYVRVFSGEAEDGDAKLVMLDLAKFCRAYKPTFDPDPRVHALLEGRREVFLRIFDHIEMSNSELFRKYVEGQPQ